jgi:hypothetical protein
MCSIQILWATPLWLGFVQFLQLAIKEEKMATGQVFDNDDKDVVGRQQRPWQRKQWQQQWQLRLQKVF